MPNCPRRSSKKSRALAIEMLEAPTRPAKPLRSAELRNRFRWCTGSRMGIVGSSSGLPLKVAGRAQSCSVTSSPFSVGTQGF